MPDGCQPRLTASQAAVGRKRLLVLAQTETVSSWLLRSAKAEVARLCEANVLRRRYSPIEGGNMFCQGRLSDGAPIPYGHLSPRHVFAASSFASMAGSGALLALISAGSLRRL